MVRKTDSLNRSAFTMIELIFAIVVIAISVISLPMVTQVTSAAMEKNLAQEAIFSAIAEINIATTYTWDGSSLIDTNSSSGAGINDLSRVVFTGTANDCVDSGLVDGAGNSIMRRPGHITRRCLNSLAQAPGSIIGYDDSLDSTEHDYNLTVEGGAATTSATGYKKEYESNLDVIRCDGGCDEDFGEAADANNINMKEITVTIRDKSDANTVTVLRTYSANIGEVAYHSGWL